MVTIGLVANVFNEANALPGWLETHLPFFDDVRVTHSGPKGEYSTDGTIELLEKWRVPVVFDSIDEGFGAVRTRAIHRSPCDYVVLLDADERLYPSIQVMTCCGELTPHAEVDDILRHYDTRDPNKQIPWELMDRLGSRLTINVGTVYHQGDWLREAVATNPDAVVTVRRHWHDFSFKRPTQHWIMEPDWQMRIVRNHDTIGFDPTTRMHERMCGVEKIFRADMERGPFFDHFHLHFKRMEPEQRAHDVAVYDKINEGQAPPTSKEFEEGRKV